MSDHGSEKALQKAWVVFSGQADLPWLKIFRPGFRHCFVLLNDGKNWVTLDPLSNYTDVCVHNVPGEFNMPLWLRDRGYKIVPAPLARTKKPAPWAVFTCVEAVKRVLGLRKRLIFTPFQLYRHLTTQQHHSSSSPRSSDSETKTAGIQKRQPASGLTYGSRSCQSSLRLGCQRDDGAFLKGELTWEV